MRLKNDALQELYDRLLNGPVLSSPYTESPVDMAFRECDEKISESATFKCIKDLQHRCDNLERSNKALRDDNDKLGNKVIELSHKNEELKKELDVKNYENADLSDRLAKLQRHHDYIDRCWTSQIQENIELKKQLGDTRKNVDGWRGRAQEAEKRLAELLAKKYDQSFEDLKKDYETVKEELDDARKNVEFYKRNRDDWFIRADDWFIRAKHAEEKNQELKKDLDNFQEENDALSSRAHCAEDKVEELKKRNGELERDRDFYFNKYQELKKDYDELTENYQDLSIKFKRYQIDVGRESRHLWDMLQNVNDSQPNEFDVECESMHDVIGMDLEDFLDAYKKWQEEKETDRMRDWLSDFCRGRLCKGCPLESEEYKCGGGYSFEKANPFDTRIIPDEDIKRYYEKARGDGDATFKPEKEEHQLEYGDAVRVPWKSYDYMYIGPEGKHIRLFDPKTHTVVVVSVRDNLTYQGCKIILCDEDDIRKIWKDKK